MPTSKCANEQLNSAIQQAVHEHFAEAHRLVPDFYRHHFLSLRCVAARHWRQRQDIPGDLLAVPRLVWQGIARFRKRQIPASRPLTGKESAVLRAIESELLRPEKLHQRISRTLRENKPDWSESWNEYGVLLQHPMNEAQRATLERFLEHKTKQLSGLREGSRDMLVFLIMGVVGNQLAGKVTFGSSLATGSALAGTVYLSQQSWWYGLWLNWSGIPGWVSWAGATGGLLTALALTPLLSPLAELLVNRLRGKRFLHKLLDEVEAQSYYSEADILDAAGLAAGISQVIPDLVALLKQLKI
jgi:hypothetical protein